MGCITITKDEAMKMINDFKGDSITVKIIQNQKETNKIPVGDVEIGQTICNGKYVVVDRYVNGDTCIVRKEVLTSNIKFGETNNYSKSDLRKYLNTEYLKEIMNEFGEIELHTVDMLSMDGDDSYGKCKDLVSAMTFDRWRKYHKYIGNEDCIEWLSTPNKTEKSNDARCVRIVDSDGCVGYSDCYWNDYGVRPFFILKSSILVSVD
ncbi:hypothetical protein [Blautia intestinalis]|uniref:hypothetical protein n=1 Tax=Blautia intestinalis TaxID=2763028 RepID=UPI0022E226BB|nr:hypothetical protein [Blautia intestinalis]